MPCLHRVFCSATKLPGTLQPLDLLSQERMILVQQQSSIKMKVLMSFLEIAGENTLFTITIQYNTAVYAKTERKKVKNSTYVLFTSIIVRYEYYH